MTGPREGIVAPQGAINGAGFRREAALYCAILCLRLFFGTASVIAAFAAISLVGGAR